MLSNAATGTTLRLEYELIIAQEIENDFMNNYPTRWSSIFVNPQATYQYLQQDTSYIINDSNVSNNNVWAAAKTVLQDNNPSISTLLSHLDDNTSFISSYMHTGFKNDSSSYLPINSSSSY